MAGTPAIRTRGALSVRAAALGGAAFFAMVVIASNLQSGSPSATDSRRETFAWLAGHQDRLQTTAVLWGFAMCAALLWLSGLFRALRRAEGGHPDLALVALGGGILAAASTVTGALIQGTIAARLDDLGPAGARIWWTMYLLSLGTTLLGLLLVVGATAVISLRTQLFAHWFGVTSAVFALVSLAGAFTIGHATDTLQTVAGVAVLLDSGWILVVSYLLWRDPAKALP